MTKLKPIVERANVPLKLQAIRKNIQEVDSKPNKTAQDALRLQRLKKRAQDLMDEHIFVVVDNTCS